MRGSCSSFGSTTEGVREDWRREALGRLPAVEEERRWPALIFVFSMVTSLSVRSGGGETLCAAAGGTLLVAVGETGGERWNEFLRMPLGRFALGGGGEWVGLVVTTAAMVAVGWGGGDAADGGNCLCDALWVVCEFV